MNSLRKLPAYVPPKPWEIYPIEANAHPRQIAFEYQVAMEQARSLGVDCARSATLLCETGHKNYLYCIDAFARAFIQAQSDAIGWASRSTEKMS